MTYGLEDRTRSRHGLRRPQETCGAPRGSRRWWLSPPPRLVLRLLLVAPGQYVQERHRQGLNPSVVDLVCAAVSAFRRRSRWLRLQRRAHRVRCHARRNFSTSRIVSKRLARNLRDCDRPGRRLPNPAQDRRERATSHLHQPSASILRLHNQRLPTHHSTPKKTDRRPGG